MVKVSITGPLNWKLPPCSNEGMHLAVTTFQSVKVPSDLIFLFIRFVKKNPDHCNTFKILILLNIVYLYQR